MLEGELILDSDNVALERYKVDQAKKSAASWFAWIGGFSVVNSALASGENQFAFLLGLGVAQIGDVWMEGTSPGFQTLGFFLSYGFAGLFIVIGWLAKHWEPAFLIGIVVYGLDSILFLIARDWVGLGFHVFVSALVIAGYRRYRLLSRTIAPMEMPQPESPAT